MVGHYLVTLCPEAEDAILGGKMRPGNYGTKTERCLVGWAADAIEKYNWRGEPTGNMSDAYGVGRYRHANTQWKFRDAIENRYDDLCGRFGTERINRAIRNRILSNQARRILQQQAATV